MPASVFKDEIADQQNLTEAEVADIKSAVEPKLLVARDPKTVAIGDLQGELRTEVNNLDNLIYGYRRGIVTQEELIQQLDRIIDAANAIEVKLEVLPQDLA